MSKSKNEPTTEESAAAELSDIEKMAKCRERYKRIKDLRAEKDRHDEAAKNCKMQIEAALAEIEDTVTRVDNQIPLPIGGPAKT